MPGRRKEASSKKSTRQSKKQRAAHCDETEHMSVTNTEIESEEDEDDDEEEDNDELEEDDHETWRAKVAKMTKETLVHECWKLSKQVKDRERSVFNERMNRSRVEKENELLNTRVDQLEQSAQGKENGMEVWSSLESERSGVVATMKQRFAFGQRLTIGKCVREKLFRKYKVTNRASFANGDIQKVVHEELGPAYATAEMMAAYHDDLIKVVQHELVQKRNKVNGKLLEQWAAFVKKGDSGCLVLRHDDISGYFNIMVGPYKDVDDDVKDFWEWMMVNIMPLVSKDWNERVKGKKIYKRDPVTGMLEAEQLHHYLSSSDFAYIPTVVDIFGYREMLGEKRKVGRTKGQVGMTQKKSITKYVACMTKLKAVYEDASNLENVNDWGFAIFLVIDEKRLGTLDEIPPPVNEITTLQNLQAASILAAQRDISQMRKDEIIIPV